jgi:ParB family chromosome partitioning protein
MSMDAMDTHMKIPLDDIRISDFCLCSEIDPDILDRVQEVYDKHGQCEPIVVISADDGYEVVVGRHRLEAARKLDRETIDATVKSYGNRQYGILDGQRTRKDIRDQELGEFCRVLSQEFRLSDDEIGDLVGLSDKTVGDKISLLTDLEDSVREKFKNGELSARKGLVILQLPEEEQPEFTQKMVDQHWTRDDLRANLENFQSDTVVTVGCEGLERLDLVSGLRKKNVDILVDVRTPGNGHFNSDELASRFGRVHGIEYRHKPEFGAPAGLLESYESRDIDHDEFGDRYRAFLDENERKFQEFGESLTGKTALMGSRKYPVPQNDQEFFCHRYHLAAELVEVGYFQRMYDIVEDGRASTPSLPPLVKTEEN